MPNNKIITPRAEQHPSFWIGDKALFQSGFIYFNMPKIIKNAKYYLYVLRDPITRDIKYVGITSNPKNRRKDHLAGLFYPNHGNNGLELWKIGVKMNNNRPIFDIIKAFDNYEKARSMERILISKLPNLLNKQP